MQEQRCGVQAGHPCTAGGQAVGDPPVPAGQVEHLDRRVQTQHPPDHVRVGVADVLEHRAVEVEIVLVEHLVEVEDRIVVAHRPTLMHHPRLDGTGRRVSEWKVERPTLHDRRRITPHESAAPAGRRPRRSPRADHARGRRGQGGRPARGRQADRPRAPRPAHRRGHLGRARDPGAPALLPAGDGRPRCARRRGHHRLRQGRRAPGRGGGLRLHRDGRLDGHDRRAQGLASARARPEQAHPDDLAARQRGSADSGGRRLAVCRQRAPVQGGGGGLRRDPAGRRAHGPLRGRHRLHPGPGRLRADGQGPRFDGARRAASRARGRGGGRDPGATRRLARALPQVGRRRSRGGRRSGVHRRGSRST